jgi:6-phosphofructokinase 2
LAFLSGKEWIPEEEIESTAREVISAGAAEILVVSLGSGGAMLLTAGESYRVKPPEAPRRSVVGAGDSMVAGIVLSLARGLSYAEALKYGVACGTAATMNEGTGLCRLEDVEQLLRVM